MSRSVPNADNLKNKKIDPQNNFQHSIFYFDNYSENIEHM